MERYQIDEIIQCLGNERTLFHYYKDRYAVYLLHRYLLKYGDQPLHQLKKSAVGFLLQKPLFQPLLATAANGVLTSDLVANYWQADSEAYSLTLGLWGGNRSEQRWNQTTRPGYNLVLQLNLSQQFDPVYYGYVIDGKNPLAHVYHPVNRQGKNTLAWARLDIDLDSGTALIEELQSDWIRDAATLKRRSQFYLNRGERQYQIWGATLDLKKAVEYADNCIARHGWWSEAMLTATLWFLWEELGIDRVYYHSFDTGNALKGLRSGKPPKSLYSQLPRKFGLQSTPIGPDFVLQDPRIKKRIRQLNQPQWFAIAV